LPFSGDEVEEGVDGFGVEVVDGFEVEDGFEVDDGFEVEDGFEVDDGFEVEDGFGVEGVPSSDWIAGDGVGGEITSDRAGIGSRIALSGT
jgi:hypothetical protein